MKLLDLLQLAAQAGSGCTAPESNVLAEGFTLLREHSVYYSETGTPQQITSFMRGLAGLSESAAARLNRLVQGEIGIKLDEYDPTKHSAKKLPLELFLIYLNDACGSTLERQPAAA